MTTTAFSFGGINVASKKQVLNLKTIKEALLYESPRASSVIVLVDEPYNKFQLQAIRFFLEACSLKQYKIISALNCVISKEQIKEDQKEGLVEFCRNNSVEGIWDMIPAGSAVITAGAALYTLTRSDHVYPTDVQQRIFGRPSFWVSPTQDSKGAWVYPIESFQTLFAEGFSSPAVPSFKTELAKFQISAAAQRTSYSSPAIPAVIKRDIFTKEEFNVFYEENKHRKREILCYDLETSGFDPFKDRVGCFTCSFDGITGYYIRWSAVDRRKLGAILANNIQLGANLKFDIKFLWKNGIPQARVDEDVIVMGHVLDETRSNSLKALAYYYTTFGGYDLALEEYRRKTGIDNYLDIPEELLKEYATLDAIVAWRVYDAMSKHMDALDAKYPNEKSTSWTQRDYYKKIRIPAVNMYARIEYRGVYVDINKLKFARAKVQARIDELQLELAASFKVPATFDFGSLKTLARLLESKGWEAQGRNKNETFQCADYQLERWAKDHKEAALLQEFRSCNVMLNTFIGDAAGTKGWSQYLTEHPEDGSKRIHPNFNAMGTESGRSRCSNPNMQNVPTHGIFASEVKDSLATPNDDEYYLMTVDYSGLQLRLSAIDSMDPVLCETFKAGNADVHAKTAYGIFIKGKQYPVETVEVEQNGRKYTFLGGQQVMTKNRGEILATELTEDDELA